MTKEKLFGLWRFSLPFLFFFVLVHFLKDITQDLLELSTPLDVLGDAKEDLSFLPGCLQQVYFYGLGGLSILAEIFLLMAIPIVWKRKELSKLESWVLAAVSFLTVFFIIAVLLDPRFNPWLDLSKQNSLPIQTVDDQVPRVLVSTDNAVNTKLFSFFTAEPDDSLALAVLLDAHKNKEIEIVGVTSTFGNNDGSETYIATKKQLELSGLEIPVVRGAEHERQGDSEAVYFITKLLEQTEGKMILVALGPVTDYAAVFKKYPELKERVALFLLIRSGPYFKKDRWFLYSSNAQQDIQSAIYMYQLGANQYSMGSEIFDIGISNETIRKIQSVKHPMIQFISKGLLKWNLQNKLFPNKGYLSRRGNMCPWDLVWTMYLIEPNLYEVVDEGDHQSLHLKDNKIFIEKVLERLDRW